MFCEISRPLSHAAYRKVHNIFQKVQDLSQFLTKSQIPPPPLGDLIIKYPCPPKKEVDIVIGDSPNCQTAFVVSYVVGIVTVVNSVGIVVGIIPSNRVKVI